MKIKALFAATALVFATSAFAADKPTLKDGVDADVKAAIEAAQASNKAANEVGFGWRDSKKQLEGAIKAANDGDNKKATKLANQVKLAGEMGLKQAEKAKTAGPRF